MIMADIDYKALQTELDEILESFNDNNLDIDIAMQLYERAAIIIGQMEQYLTLAENKITKIKDSIRQIE